MGHCVVFSAVSVAGISFIRGRMEGVSAGILPAGSFRSRLSLCAQSFMFWNKRMC